MMTAVNRRKVLAAQAAGRLKVGTIYRRTRGGVQRAEVRFDGISGCLRTPTGGSSRQTIIVVEGAHLRTRLLSSREAARLMGLPDSYKLPKRYNDAYHLAGDGVVVPVVSHLAKHLLTPLASRQARLHRVAA
jgi:DNA (cytosine-5)-methyltransferase 1